MLIRLLLSVLWICVLEAHLIAVMGPGFNNNLPPPYTEKARTARYIVHNSNWTIAGTISTMKEIAGRPFTNIFSFCDGPINNSTGTPYFYVMDMDASMRDILQGSMMSMTLSEEMSGYCKSKAYDPEYPRCARLTLTGKMVNITGDERKFALNALFSRHPAMEQWSVAHEFYPTKLQIDMVWLLDYFGAPSVIAVEDYYAAQP